MQEIQGCALAETIYEKTVGLSGKAFISAALSR
jgi:hypothetical protein